MIVRDATITGMRTPAVVMLAGMQCVDCDFTDCTVIVTSTADAGCFATCRFTNCAIQDNGAVLGAAFWGCTFSPLLYTYNPLVESRT